MKSRIMNKKLIAAVATGCLVGLTSPVFAAAAGGFDDVPRDNWSYGAIQTLLKDGVIDSFDDNTFNGQKIVTRFEMAQIIRRATNKAVNSSSVSSSDKELIIKLSKEYGKELNQLKSGSLSNSSNNSAAVVRPGKNGIMDFSGTKTYVRYDYWNNKSNYTNRTDKSAGGDKGNFFMDVELRGRYEFAPKWNARFMYEMQRAISGQSLQEDGEGDLKEFSIDGPLKVGKLKNSKFQFGRFKYKPVLGYVTKAYMQGGIWNFQANKKLKVEVAYGDLSERYYRSGGYNTSDVAGVDKYRIIDSKGNVIASYDSKTDSKGVIQNKDTKTKLPNIATTQKSYYNSDSAYSVLYAPYSEQMGVISLRYQADRKTRLYGGFYTLNSKHKSFHDAQIYELAGQRTLDKDFTLYFDWARSSRSEDNSLYYLGLKYKNESLSKPHSWSWLVQGAFHEAKATINSDLDIKNYGVREGSLTGDTAAAFNGDSGSWYYGYNTARHAYNGAKGFAVTYKWVPLAHSVLVLRGMYFEPIHVDASCKDAMKHRFQFRTEYDIYF